MLIERDMTGFSCPSSGVAASEAQPVSLDRGYAALPQAALQLIEREACAKMRFHPALMPRTRA